MTRSGTWQAAIDHGEHCLPSLGVCILIYRQWSTIEGEKEADKSSTMLQNAGQLDWTSIQRQSITSSLSKPKLRGFRQATSCKPSIHPFIHWTNTYWTPTIMRSKWGNPYKMFSNSWNTVVIFKNWGQITFGKSEASPFQVSFSMQ